MILTQEIVDGCRSLGWFIQAQVPPGTAPALTFVPGADVGEAASSAAESLEEGYFGRVAAEDLFASVDGSHYRLPS